MFILLVLTSLLADVTASRDLALKSGFNVPASLETREGQNSLSVDCCQVITTFTNKCWPFMLTSFGFNTKQGNLLQGYCDTVPRLATASVAGSSQLQYSRRTI
uniref:Prolamin-like domain-containing protein n=1 Tax=Quercus lobata TaxID=97700 RepID=A0A7N2LYV0_QUELO